MFFFSPYSNVTALLTDLGNKRQCNHFCKNKDLCGHDCCEYNHSSFTVYVSLCALMCLPASLCVPVKIIEVFFFQSVNQSTYVSRSQGKVGVTRRRSANQESSFSSYLKDLRSRCDTLAHTPVKRLKVRRKTDMISSPHQILLTL